MPEIKQAQGTTFKTAIAIVLDEALTSLDECIEGLTDEQAWARPFTERNAIAVLVMHVLENMNRYTCVYQTGVDLLENAGCYDLWNSGDVIREDLPTVDYMHELIGSIRKAATAALEPLSDMDMLAKAPNSDGWWNQSGRTSVDAYMRTTMHAMAHIRQIWYLRGVMGMTDTQGWPEQHWA